MKRQQWVVTTRKVDGAPPTDKTRQFNTFEEAMAYVDRIDIAEFNVHMKRRTVEYTQWESIAIPGQT